MEMEKRILHGAGRLDRIMDNYLSVLFDSECTGLNCIEFKQYISINY